MPSYSKSVGFRAATPSRTRASKALSTPPWAGSDVNVSNSAEVCRSTSVRSYSQVPSGLISRTLPSSRTFQRQSVSRRLSSSRHWSTAWTTLSPPSQKLITSPGIRVSSVGWRGVGPCRLGSRCCCSARLSRLNMAGSGWIVPEVSASTRCAAPEVRGGGAQMIAGNPQLALNSLLPALLRGPGRGRIQARLCCQRALAAHCLERVRDVGKLGPGLLYVDQPGLAVEACFGVAYRRAPVGERRVLAKRRARPCELIEQVARLRLLRTGQAAAGNQ